MKITMILLILTIVAWVIGKAIANTVTLEEKAKAYIHNDVPTRVTVAALIFVLLAVSTVISTIIMIIKW